MSRREPLLAAILFVAVAAVLLGALVPRGATHILTDDFQAGPGRSDAYTFLWGQWWVHTALAEGRSPFLCDRVFPPDGADVRFHSVLWVPAFVTFPLAAVAGEVIAYNLTIAALLAGAAFVMYLTLRRTLLLRLPVALIFAALFGFAPYFVFKVHAHPNLAGAVFWGGALSLLLHALLRGSGRLSGMAFAAVFWLCFWNSLVEWVMLAVAAAVIVLAAVLLRRIAPDARRELRLPWRWFLPTAWGLPSLALLFGAPPDGLARSLFPPPTADVWFGFPRLSLLASDAAQPRYFEYAGTGIPWGIAALAAAGILRGARVTRGLLGLTLAALILLAVDPFGLLSAGVRALPFGQAVRVFARFFPFALFFAVAIAATAADRAWREANPRLRVFAAAALALAVLETVPRGVHPSPVVTLNVPPSVRSGMDDSKAVLVLPLAARDYPRRREVYQVELGMPFVHMGHLTREDPEAVRRRAEAFPLFYSGATDAARGVTTSDLAADLERLGVGYVLFDRPEQWQLFPLKGEILHRTTGEILMQLPRVSR